MGQLVCLEGIDGCGKDTQAPLVVARLVDRQLRAVTLTFPDYGSALGALIARSLQDPGQDAASLQMLFSAERVGRREEILAAVRDHDFVVTSRYSASGIVYGSQRGLPLAWLEGLESVLPTPNRMILLDISAEVSLQRSQGRDVLDSNFSLMTRCRTAYLDLAHTHSSLWSVVDASCPRDVLTDRLLPLILASQA